MDTATTQTLIEKLTESIRQHKDELRRAGEYPTLLLHNHVVDTCAGTTATTQWMPGTDKYRIHIETTTRPTQFTKETAEQIAETLNNRTPDSELKATAKFYLDWHREQIKENEDILETLQNHLNKIKAEQG